VKEQANVLVGEEDYCRASEAYARSAASSQRSLFCYDFRTPSNASALVQRTAQVLSNPVNSQLVSNSEITDLLL